MDNWHHVNKSDISDDIDTFDLFGHQVWIGANADVLNFVKRTDEEC